MRVHLATVAIAAGALVATAMPGGASATVVARAAARHHGNVNVLYAASLQTIMESVIGPRFEKATGYTFTGYSGASGTLANEVKGGVQAGDVFISASPTVNATLQGAANGNWVTWYAAFASSPLVIGYNPHSPFAPSLKREPWYEAITQPGIRVGRTDPTTDPKGKLTVQAITAAEQIYSDPALASVIASTANIYPEQTLVGLLQSGQLDAGFFYSSEAKASKIPTISLRRLYLAATYTVATLSGDADPVAANAFVAFLLGSQGRKLMKQQGLTVLAKPRLIGTAAEVPKSLRSLLVAAK